MNFPLSFLLHQPVAHIPLVFHTVPLEYLAVWNWSA